MFFKPFPRFSEWTNQERIVSCVKPDTLGTPLPVEPALPAYSTAQGDTHTKYTLFHFQFHFYSFAFWEFLKLMLSEAVLHLQEFTVHKRFVKKTVFILSAKIRRVKLT